MTDRNAHTLVNFARLKQIERAGDCNLFVWKKKEDRNRQKRKERETDWKRTFALSLQFFLFLVFFLVFLFFIERTVRRARVCILTNRLARDARFLYWRFQGSHGKSPSYLRSDLQTPGNPRIRQVKTFKDLNDLQLRICTYTRTRAHAQKVFLTNFGKRRFSVCSECALAFACVFPHNSRAARDIEMQLFATCSVCYMRGFFIAGLYSGLYK